MKVTRRTMLMGAAAGATATALARPAIAASEPIKIGFLPALTGPSSSTGVAINRGTLLAVEEINKGGGVKGRKLEIVSRDTQSDPTKAVNGATELARREKVNVIWGPLNSGEALAATPLIARDGLPQLDSCWVDALTDPKKWPLAFRNAPTNQQVGAAATHYAIDVLKAKKVAIIGDTTGYGTASVDAYVPMVAPKGGTVVYKNEVDASNPDLTPELLRMRNAGAEVIMPWSVNAGFLSRIINTRGQMGWDVPIVGQTTLGSGQTKALLAKPEYWGKVYQNNFRPCSYLPNGKLPDRTQAFVERLRKNNIEMGDTLLWWIALGYDAPFLIADAVKNAGSSPKEMAGYWDTLTKWPGVYGTLTFTKDNHNGYPDDEVVMCQANSFRDGAFNLAPGYGT
ncbi:MAG TPA: ABC transporter substrate-binding protein [Rhodopila sp.]|uniref:ABC transporter substrate-binding protein n=1 Tax=Rhodopila sp. TaxID=2480087 RepID=UPI002D010598|nr:ABC transporter substrate-binding protein [Rhodopila sp.]HVY18096.1 ABC transporter substrate-binding protein [Rhodopila sp.]